jgi:hypothetical protein
VCHPEYKPCADSDGTIEAWAWTACEPEFARRGTNTGTDSLARGLPRGTEGLCATGSRAVALQDRGHLEPDLDWKEELPSGPDPRVVRLGTWGLSLIPLHEWESSKTIERARG